MNAPAVRNNWNSLEVAKLLASICTPLVIWTVGVWATNAARNAENTRQEDAANAAYSRSLQQLGESKDLQITQAYLQAVQAANACGNERHVYLLIVHGTPELAERLGRDFSDRCSSTAAAEAPPVLARIVEQSRSSQVSRILSDLEGPARGAARIELRQAFEAAPAQLAADLAEGLRKNSRNYRITLGILIALADSNAKWDGNGPLGKEVDALRKSSNLKDAKYKEWFDKAQANRLPVV